MKSYFLLKSISLNKNHFHDLKLKKAHHPKILWEIRIKRKETVAIVKNQSVYDYIAYAFKMAMNARKNADAITV